MYPLAAQMLAQRLSRPMQMPSLGLPAAQAGQPQAQGFQNRPRLFFGGQWIEPDDPRYDLFKQMILQKYQQGGAYGR